MSYIFLSKRYLFHIELKKLQCVGNNKLSRVLIVHFNQSVKISE